MGRDVSTWIAPSGDDHEIFVPVDGAQPRRTTDGNGLSDEAGAPSVFVDLLRRSHFALGVEAPELGRIIAGE